jgi:putative ABC transport system substrate-binding protein
VLNRRQFVAGASVTRLGLLVGCGRLPWQAQVPATAPRIGVLAGDPSAPSHAAFRQALRDLGYVEGQNIHLEYRFTEGRAEPLPNLAAELVALPVDVLVVANQASAEAAKNATATIPIGLTNNCAADFSSW